MIDSITIKNLGVNKNIEWTNLGNINVLIGKNGSGKTSILKMLYSMLRIKATPIGELMNHLKGRFYAEKREIVSYGKETKQRIELSETGLFDEMRGKR